MSAGAPPPLKMEKDFDETKLVRVKLSQTYDENTTSKQEVPVFDGAKIEALFYCLNEFREAAAYLDYDEGAELFQNFRLTLSGVAKEHWDTVISGMGDEDKTPEIFNDCIDMWKRTFMSKNARASQICYLKTVHKTRKVDVRTFTHRIETIARYVKEMPSEDPTLTLSSSDLKQIVIQSMPVTWQQSFHRSHASIHSLSMPAITEYMNQEAEFVDQNNTRREQGKPFSSFAGRGTHRGNQGRGIRNQHNQSNYVERYNNVPSSGPSSDRSGSTPCRHHGGRHLWKDCIFNRKSANYRGQGRGGFGGRGQRDGTGRGTAQGGRGFGRGNGYTGVTHEGNHNPPNGNQTNRNSYFANAQPTLGPPSMPALLTYPNDDDQSYYTVPGHGIPSRATMPAGRGGMHLSGHRNISNQTAGALPTVTTRSWPGLFFATGNENDTLGDVLGGGLCAVIPSYISNNNDTSSSLTSYVVEQVQDTDHDESPANNVYFVASTTTQDINIRSNVHEFHDDLRDYISYTFYSDFHSYIFSNSSSTPTCSTITSEEDHVPSTLLIAEKIQDQPSMRPLRALFDSGGTNCLFHARGLPSHAKPDPLPTSRPLLTAAGTFQVAQTIQLHNIVLPEFSPTRRIQLIHAHVFDAPSPYDVILGRDLLLQVGIDTCFSTRKVHWMDEVIDMKPPTFLRSPFEASAFFDNPDEFILASYLLDSKYEQIDTLEVAKQQQHLSSEQQVDLANTLKPFHQLFNGKLGKYPHRQVHLTLEPDAQPVHLRPYPVPHVHEEVFKKELHRLCDIGVLEPCGASEWAAPTFVVPKKDGRVRWLSDFRALNKAFRRKVYPLPNIMTILRRRNGYVFFTKLDISMQYYAFELDEASREFCVIITPFGKYRYLRLPMGIKQSPDFAQEIMEHVLRDIPEVEVYIDDVGIFSTSWSEHLRVIALVLHKLEINGFTVNPLKCEWAVEETDWLGYWLTPQGLKPWSKKIQAILNLRPPQTVAQIRSFVGAVTFYRDMWPRRSHILAPLTQITGRGSFTWGPEQWQAFETMKALIAEETMLRYPDHNLPFHVFTDASDYQLGSVIMQEDLPVAYYSRKLSPPQQNYTTIEKELLSIVETLKEFRSMLLGARELHVYTDHRNLTFTNLTSQRVLRWRLYLEEYHPIFHWIRGDSNVVADALSRLPLVDSSEEKTVGPQPTPSTKPMDTPNTTPSSYHSIVVDDRPLMECFLNLPPPEEMPFPLHFALLQQHQQQDDALQERRQLEPDTFPTQVFDNEVQLICYVQQDQPWRIAIPTSLLTNIVRWYHQVLNHVGESKLFDTIRTHFYHPYLKHRIQHIVSTCDICQRNKLPGIPVGELPPREANAVPWDEVAVDLIGPWSVQLHGEVIPFEALTCIDTVSNLVELCRKSAGHIAMLFENQWLARYPRPMRCIHDQGKEFIGAEFKRMLQINGIQDVPTTTKNPQANSICERMHQTVGNILRTYLHGHQVYNMVNARHIVDCALATASHATRCAVHRTLDVSPGALVFQRDMLLNIPIVADLEYIRDKRQILIDENLRRQNLRRRHHDYQVGDEVLMLVPNPNKLEPRAKGPFIIQQVHANRTLSILRHHNVIERINIRRVKPYRRADG